MIRCPRCARSNEADAAECAGCGLGLTAATTDDPARQGTADVRTRQPVGGTSAGASSGAPTDPAEPTELTELAELTKLGGVAPPAGPAPWERPPEAVAETETSSRWRPGDAGSDAVASAPPRTRPRQGYPRELAGATRLVAMIVAVLAAAYGVFGLAWRRGIFDRIGSGADVSAEARQISDVVNGVLFGAVGLATVAAFGLLVFWAIRTRPHVDRIALGILCWTSGVLGLLAVVTALAMQRGDDSGEIATGYVVLGIGWLLLALAAVAVARAIRRATRQAESGSRGHVR